jgi:hypothetical protein
MANSNRSSSPGTRLRAAVEAEHPLQMVGTITAHQQKTLDSLFAASKEGKT